MQLLVNGTVASVPFVDDATRRVFQLGKVGREDNETVYQCISGTRVSSETTLDVFCK